MAPWSRCGQVVSLLAIYSNDPSLNPAEVYNFLTSVAKFFVFNFAYTVGPNGAFELDALAIRLFSLPKFMIFFFCPIV